MVIPLDPPLTNDSDEEMARYYQNSTGNVIGQWCNRGHFPMLNLFGSFAKAGETVLKEKWPSHKMTNLNARTGYSQQAALNQDNSDRDLHVAHIRARSAAITVSDKCRATLIFVSPPPRCVRP